MINSDKHGLSFAAVGEFDFASATVVTDDRKDYGETGYRAFARMAGIGYCLVFTADGETLRQSAIAAPMKRKCAVMASKKEPVFDADNPEWTEADFARARPAEEVLPKEIFSAWRQKRSTPNSQSNEN